MARTNAKLEHKTARPRGRPRSERCRVAVRKAVVEMLDDLSYGAITVEAIALRAGVSKQTIYRWWSGKHQLAMEAFAEIMEAQVAVVPSGKLEVDLQAIMRRSCRVLNERQRGTTLTGLIVAAQHDDAFAKEFRDRYILVRRRAIQAILEKGITDGKLRRDLDVQLGIDQLYGPIWYRLLLRHRPIDDAFADSLARSFLAAYAT